MSQPACARYLDPGGERGGRIRSICSIKGVPSRAPMASVSEVQLVRVQAPWLKQPLDISQWSVINGKRYMKLAKCDSKVSRMLAGEAPSKARALTDTSIIAELQKLRNVAAESLLQDTMSAATSGTTEDDLGLDASEPGAKRRKVLEESLPEEITIKAPPIGDHAGLDMSVATALGTEPLQFELVGENIDYLRAAFGAQSGHQPKAEGSTSSGKEAALGVWWHPGKEAWRVRYPSDGKYKYKFFKPSRPKDQASISEAEEEAKAFARAQR